MRSQQKYIITKDELYTEASHCLQESLKFKYHGTKCSVTTLLQVLLTAASRMGSVYVACRDLADAPCDQTIRNALAATMPQIHVFERRLNLALTTKLSL